MRFLKNKFFDTHNHISSFLEEGNTLRRLENDDVVTDKIKSSFTDSFKERLVKDGVIKQETIDVFDDKNPWSIDFPGWHGTFSEDKGKQVFVVGSEPHIQHRYLQTVYGLHNDKTTDYLLTESNLRNFK